MKKFFSTLCNFMYSSKSTRTENVTNSPQMVVTKMVNALDMKEWDVVRSYFVDSVFVDYSSMTGQAGGERKSTDLIEGWENLLKTVHTHHMVTNFVVNVECDKAETQAHVYASHTAEGIPYWDIYGRYLHKLTKTPHGWKITSMTLIVHGQKGNTNFLAEVMAQI